MRQIRSAVTALAALAAFASCSNDEPLADAGEEAATSAPDSEYTILPDEGADHLEPGRWAVANPDGPAPLAVLDLPAGFGGGEGVLFYRGESAVGYWLADRVYQDPCSAGELAVKVGGSVEDLAAALTAQKVTRTTKPVPVSIDGHTGLYLELTTPTDFDYKACNKNALYIWDTPTVPSGARFIDEPGTDHYWILDVEGQRVVLLTWVPRGVKEETAELLSDVVEGAAFVADH